MATFASRAAQGSIVFGAVHAGLTLASFVSSFPTSARVTPVGEGIQPQVQSEPNTCAPPSLQDTSHPIRAVYVDRVERVLMFLSGQRDHA